MAIGEWVAPQGEQMARNYRAQAMYGGSLLSTQQGLWAKDGVVQTMAKSAARQVTNQIVRGMLGSLLGGRRR